MIGSPSRFGAVQGRLCLIGLAATATGLSTSAAAQARWGVDTSVSAGVSTNPTFDPGTSTTSATGNVDVRPSLVIERPLTTLTVSADANVAFYSQNSGTNESFSFDGALNHRLSERTSLNASVDYRNSIIGSFNDVRVPVVDPAADPTIATTLPAYVDPGLAGLGRRRQSYEAAVGLGTSLSPRDQLSVNVSASANRFGGLAFSDFNYLAPAASYSRLLGEGFNIGASMSVGFTDYVGTRVGDATVYQPQLTASKRLSESLTLDLGAGVGIASVRDTTGISSTTTSFNGSASLCRRNPRFNACLTASRQTLPSAYQGVRTQTQAAVSLGYKIGPRDDLSFTGSYSHSGAPVQQTVVGVRGGSVDYLSSSGNLSHRFGRALSGFVSAGLNKSFDEGFGRSANFTALLGLTYSFGRR